MASTAPLRGLNRGLKRYKYRCYEQVRNAANGMGCEWSHDYFRDEACARRDPVDISQRTEIDSHEDEPEFRRTQLELWGPGGVRNGQGSTYMRSFEAAAVRDNDWHRKRSEDCINPPDDDEDWIDD